MGIPGLNSWFKRKFAHAYVPLSQVHVDHLYVDMNSVLHLVLRRARNMHHFYCLLFVKCDEILNSCQPRKSVLLALDGPAPLAKLLTQRIRRKRVSLTPSDKKGKTISPLALTPGTPFMQDVHEALAYFICQRLIGSKWQHLRMELSGSTVQGEGECKILARLQQPLDFVDKKDSHVLVGNDSDLLMMSLIARCEKVFVFGQILAEDRNQSAGHQPYKVFSVEALHRIFLSMMSKCGIADKEGKKKLVEGLRQDLAVTCILSRGNDYLPSVNGLSIEDFVKFATTTRSDEKLWSKYLQLRDTEEFRKKTLAMTSDHGVQLNYEFLYQLLKQENQRLSERKIMEYQKGPDPHLYLDGLRWVLNMYFAGVCPDYRFVYDGLGPSYKELCEAILERNQNPRKMENGGTSRLPLKPSECALALLPYHARQYIPQSIQHLMDPDSPIGDLYQDCEVFPASCFLYGLKLGILCGQECNRISEATGKAQIRLQELRKQSAAMKLRLDEMDSNSSKARQIQKAMDELDEKIEQVRGQLRELASEREAHNIEKHPYQPFPINRIENAVRNLSVTDFSDKDHELFRFGHDYVFERMKKKNKTSKERAKFNRIFKNAPEPPSDRFQKFKLPLPILRGRYTSNPTALRAFSTNTRHFLTIIRKVLV